MVNDFNGKLALTFFGLLKFGLGARSKSRDANGLRLKKILV
jgi:hypothetical protein